MPLKTKTATSKDVSTAQHGVELQHRHFAFIAATIAKMPDAGYRADIALHFADECAVTNPRFDRARFLRACNVSI